MVIAINFPKLHTIKKTPKAYTFGILLKIYPVELARTTIL
jgi:hypothetical protein